MVSAALAAAQRALAPGRDLLHVLEKVLVVAVVGKAPPVAEAEAEAEALGKVDRT